MSHRVGHEGFPVFLTLSPGVRDAACVCGAAGRQGGRVWAAWCRFGFSSIREWNARVSCVSHLGQAGARQCGECVMWWAESPEGGASCESYPSSRDESI
ncbi:hypothetical protein E2C01_064534 [Portunus trituberculatus]|uniref:Uncharacterized protein n=1 Tax=Portunus trituberculatus TaxID=210409 RepID=A0A5B7HD95_PORTR|nr:hypothetical protein [Portunus trituberculatus]